MNDCVDEDAATSLGVVKPFIIRQPPEYGRPDRNEITYLTTLYRLFHFDKRWSKPQHETYLEDEIPRFRRFGHAHTLFDSERHRFLTKNVFPGLGCGQHYFLMQMGRHADENGVNALRGEQIDVVFMNDGDLAPGR